MNILHRILQYLKRKILANNDRLHSNKEINFRNKGIINLIDIGSVGLLPEPWLTNKSMIKTLLKFEPRDEKVSIKNIITLDVALFNINATLPFYIYKGFNQTGSSLFKQNYEYVKENFEELSKHGPLHLSETWFERSELVREEKLLCRRLDDILKEKNISSNFHFIKIDAQGAEFEILQGGENTLKNCIGLHLELFSVPLYQGIKLLPDVEQFLSSAGFTLVKKFPAHGTFDSQNDCVFLKLNTTLTRELKLIKNIYGIK